MKRTTTLICLALGVLLLPACKKSYTCACTVTEQYSSTDTTYTNVAHNTSSAYSKKMTEKQAKAACDSEASSLQATDASIIANYGGSQDPNDHVTYSCALK